MRNLNRNQPILGKLIKTEFKPVKSKDLKIIAVDFDGTLVFNKYPYIENPNLKLINFIKQNFDKYIWILWTCRHGEQLKYAVDYMRTEHGIVFDYVNENVPWLIEEYGECRKVSADYYIDDRCWGEEFFK